MIKRREAGPDEETTGADDRQNPAHAGEEVRIVLGAFGNAVVFHHGFVAVIHTPELLVEG
ncbi:hypothetical protein D3C85_1899900 [compost metagenome]